MTDLHPLPRKSGRSRTRVVSLSLALLVAGVVGVCLKSRGEAHAELAERTSAEALPAVSVISPAPEDKPEEVVLPGNLSAFTDAAIYARTSGYLKRWHVDIGAHVKTGELLAEIDSPEVDQQLHQAQADLATAQVNYELAATTAARYVRLQKTEAVAQQDTDDRTSDANAKRAMVDSARANVERLTQLQSFERVYAPFDGVITERNTDTGALINAGNTVGQQLFRIVASDKLRLYVPVPEPYAAAIQPGMAITLTVAEHPGVKFPAELAGTAGAVDPASRTLQVQLAVDNRQGQLFAGSYAEVHFNMPAPTNGLRVPVSALLFRSEGLTLATVGADGVVSLKHVQIGRDFGNEVEVVAGLDASDRVVVNVPDGIGDGEHVALAPSAEAVKVGSAS